MVVLDFDIESLAVGADQSLAVEADQSLAVEADQSHAVEADQSLAVEAGLDLEGPGVEADLDPWDQGWGLVERIHSEIQARHR